MRQQVLVFCGHHKGGTVWASKIFASACRMLGLRGDYVASPKQFGFDLASHVQSNQLDFVCYANASPEYLRGLGSYRGFHIIRDPRDTVVSGYFSHRNSHPTRNWPELVRHRERLQQVPLDEGLRLEIDFSAALPTDGVNLNPFQALSSWDYQDPHMLELRFEDVTANPRSHFRQVFRFLGLLAEDSEPGDGRITVSQLDEIIEQNDFSRHAGGRQPGAEDANSHYRKGVAGDWKNYFDAETSEYFKQRYGELLVALNYESSNAC